jgi:hypothetical protein
MTASIRFGNFQVEIWNQGKLNPSFGNGIGIRHRFAGACLRHAGQEKNRRKAEYKSIKRLVEPFVGYFLFCA